MTLQKSPSGVKGVTTCDQQEAMGILSRDGLESNTCMKIILQVNTETKQGECIQEVKDMQHIYELTVDGLIGPNTIKKMQEELKKMELFTPKDTRIFEGLNTFCPEGSAFCKTAGSHGVSDEEARRYNEEKGTLADVRTSLFEKLAQIITGIASSFAIFMIILASIKMAANSNDSSQFQNSLKDIKHALIGLVVIILAYFLVTNIVNLLYDFFG